jgi:hypothetical protein
VNNEYVVVKLMEFDKIVGLMKMLLLNPGNFIELWE